MTDPSPIPIAGAAPRPVHQRTMAVQHITVYRYDGLVQRGEHTFRLRPVEDWVQQVLEHQLSLSIQGELLEHDDVFGNHVYRLEGIEAFSELRIEARSVVRIKGGALRHAHNPPRPLELPLVWMPWQQQMMLPYLLPPELPESELKELSDYAASFRSRNQGDLVRTLVDMTETLHREYEYVFGSTNMETTPFEVYQSRRGVCQDFANLFICLARLQGVPARYRVGYIHTAAPELQSQASHAWVEVYLPWLGWRGFDPTNGILVGMDHIRVAAGRNYIDATPTAGIISPAGLQETLEVNVSVEIVDESNQ